MGSIPTKVGKKMDIRVWLIKIVVAHAVVGQQSGSALNPLLSALVFGR